MAQKSKIEPRPKGTGRLELLPLGVYSDPEPHQSSSLMLPNFKFHSLVLLLFEVFCISSLILSLLSQTNCSLLFRFNSEIESGLVEIVAPSSSFYPDLDAVPLTFGDSRERVR